MQLVLYEPPASYEVYLASVFCSENSAVSLRHWYQNFTGTYHSAVQKKKKKSMFLTKFVASEISCW